MGFDKFAAEYLTARKVDLNGDGQSELIVETPRGGICWGAHGTETWIYRNVGGRWQQLFNSEGSGQSITVANTKTRGFLDIVLRSATVFDLYISDYKFDGNRYQACGTKYYSRSDPRGRFILKTVESGKCK
jgi:hypothetical protein